MTDQTDLSNEQQPPSSSTYVPTPAEVQLLRMLVDGATDEAIAQSMYISKRTVQNHLSMLRSRVGVARRTELACWAVEHSIV